MMRDHKSAVGMQVVLFLIFLAPTIQYRVELGLFSFAVMEPIVLLACAVLILQSRSRGERLRIHRRWPEISLIGLVAWATLIRPWEQDWKHGLSDVRDWIIPVTVFFSLRTTVRRGWGKAIGALMGVTLLTAVLGIFQGVTGGFRPFMSAGARLKLTPHWETIVGPGWDQSDVVSLCELHSARARLSEQGMLADDFSQDATSPAGPAPFAVGLFTHPNALGIFLSAGLMISLGWAIDRRGVLGWVWSVVIAIAVVWTYSQGAYAVVAFELVIFFALHLLRSARAIAAVVAVSLLAAIGVLALIPSAMFNPLCWRLGLWTTARDLLLASPSILAFGNGMPLFGDLAYYFQPHNTYIYLLLEYGLPGLIIVLAMLIKIVVTGLRDRYSGLWARGSLLPAAWIAVIGFFVAGIVESVLMGIESRTIVVTFLACYLGLRDEIVEELGFHG